MRYNKLSIVLILTLLTASSAVFAQLSGLTPSEPVVTTKSFLSVDKIKPGTDFQLAIKASVKNGYHIGAREKDSLYPARLTLAAPKGIVFETPQFPQALRKTFPFSPDKKIPVYEGTFVILVRGSAANGIKTDHITITSKLDTQACKNDQCYPPSTVETNVGVNIARAGESIKKINTEMFRTAAASGTGGVTGNLSKAPTALRFVMLYGLGILLAFTPCVYPMVPVTMGYFSGQSKSRKTRKVLILAGAYVLGIALTYSTLGAIASIPGHTFGEVIQRYPLQVNVGIAAILIALAFSMFGYYELQAPSFIQNKASGRSGVLGALFMGLIFGIVAAPCVGPVVLGLMTYVASLGSPVMGFLLFFALSLGIGTPLFALAAFSAKMPVPGMWMVAVKKAAGFLLIGVAAYFLKQFMPDAIGRLMVPAVIVVGGIYLGFFEKSIHVNRSARSLGRTAGSAALIVALAMAIPKPAGQKMQWQPYQPGKISVAAKSGKPVMIDFTAKWCAACQELEHGPFSDQSVIKAAKGFEKLRVDGTNSSDPRVTAAEKRFNVSGFPTVIFLDSHGKEIKSARITGFVDSKEMIRRIEDVGR